MKSRLSIFVVCIFLVAGISVASPPRTQKALWIDTNEHGERKTTVAVTEGIARLLLESTNLKLNGSEKDKGELITKQMLLSVLNGDEEVVQAKDSKSEAKIYKKKLNVPGKLSGNNRLVMETFESGKSKFRIALPEIEVTASNDEGNSHSYVSLILGWKTLLPFLAKEGGAVYIHDHEKDSEIWVYVE